MLKFKSFEYLLERPILWETPGAFIAFFVVNFSGMTDLLLIGKLINFFNSTSNVKLFFELFYHDIILVPLKLVTTFELSYAEGNNLFKKLWPR